MTARVLAEQWEFFLSQRKIGGERAISRNSDIPIAESLSPCLQGRCLFGLYPMIRDTTRIKTPRTWDAY